MIGTPPSPGGVSFLACCGLKRREKPNPDFVTGGTLLHASSNRNMPRRITPFFLLFIPEPSGGLGNDKAKFVDVFWTM